MIPKKSLDSVLDKSIILTITAPNDNAKSISVQCAGGGFPNTSMVFGEGESFFKQFNGFRRRRKQNESMVFQCFPRLTLVAPVPFF